MELKYIDAHTHVQFVAFDADRDAVFDRAYAAGIGMNLVGTQKDTSTLAVSQAKSREGVWATIGLHPVHTSKSHHDEKELGEGGKAFTSRGEQFDPAAYEALAREPKVIAIGECGLDYYRLEAQTKDIQQEAFIQQIMLANTVQKPLMLHIRNNPSGDGGDAYGDALSLLKTHAKVLGDVHFFAGSWEVAKKFLDIGFMLSFTGVVTFTHDYDEVVEKTPLHMMLSETDAPYITPTPYRGKRNEPLYVPEIVKRIAAIKGIETEVAREQLYKNAQTLFGIL